ncbi:hypothetical protein J6590_029244 [Homalodisca vitripennis]|nr:hypothetical protein J6590_029244 [Homalodisca vitripennis]
MSRKVFNSTTPVCQSRVLGAGPEAAGTAAQPDAALYRLCPGAASTQRRARSPPSGRERYFIRRKYPTLLCRRNNHHFERLRTAGSPNYTERPQTDTRRSLVILQTCSQKPSTLWARSAKLQRSESCIESALFGSRIYDGYLDSIYLAVELPGWSRDQTSDFETRLSPFIVNASSERVTYINHVVFSPSKEAQNESSPPRHGEILLCSRRVILTRRVARGVPGERWGCNLGTCWPRPPTDANLQLTYFALCSELGMFKDKQSEIIGRRNLFALPESVSFPNFLQDTLRSLFSRWIHNDLHRLCSAAPSQYSLATDSTLMTNL